MSDATRDRLLTDAERSERVAESSSQPTPASSNGGALLRSSSTMAVGTIFSRLTGMVRTSVLAAAIGLATLNDAYTVANTVPNILYILLLGGAINSIFIPQLVRHLKDDTDGGRAYSDRLLTITTTILVGLSVLAVIAAPLLVRLYAGNGWNSQDIAVSTAFARYCLPQILFYGLFTLFSQVLNARGRFAAPMYAPIVNNAVVIATCLLFIVVEGPVSTTADVGPSEVALLGIGTTLGIAVQALVLIPVMARAGYVWRPRFDWRGAGLGKAGKLATWTFVFVLTNQLSYIVISRLANTSGKEAAHGGGLGVYSNAYLLFMLPQSVITVSVVTALLPRMSRNAHAGRMGAVRGDVSRGLRFVGALIVPSAVLLLLLGRQIGVLLFDYGSVTTSSAEYLGQVTQAFAVGLPAFAAFYVLLRGFYALEDTRTPARVNFVLNVLNVGISFAIWQALPADRAVIGLALGYSLAYIISFFVLAAVLRSRIGGIDSYDVVRAYVRLGIAAALMAGGMLATLAALNSLGLQEAGKLAALLQIVIAGAVGGLVFLGAARVMHVREATDVVDTVRRKLGR